MRTPVSVLLALALCCAAGFAAEAPMTPPPDQAATEALRSLQDMIARGEVGWWKSQADPSIQFLNKYGGLGGDTVAALSLNQAEQLWPAWKTVGGGLERFGIACSVYNCLKSAGEGNYNAAVLNALKDFLKYRLSKMGDAMATSAAGVGLIDFALNSFGEAAMQQIADDYWFIYCRYQTQRHPRLGDYVRLITQGDGTLRGFDAVVASLDSFWDDPATDGIRGFAALKTQDPDYRANFRVRYLKENLLPFLTAWAERERDREEAASWVALRRLTEQLNATVVAVDFAVVEEGLNEPPTGATVDVVVEFYSPKAEVRVLASAPVTTRNRLEFPLTSALSADRKLPRSLKIRLHRPTATGASGNSTTNFEVPWINPAAAWRREVAAGRLSYVAKQPLFTADSSECAITLTGAGAEKIFSLRFQRLPVGTSRDVRDLARAPGGTSVDIKAAQGKVRLGHGLYLVSCDNELSVFTHGPVKIGGPTMLTIPVRAAAEQTPQTPSPDVYRNVVRQAADGVRDRQPNQREVIAQASASLQEYWLSTYTAINGYLATARALQEKLNAELRAPALTVEQQRAIRQRYEPRIAEMEKAKDATERVVWDLTREQEKVTSEITAAAQQRYNTVRRELSAASDELGNGLGAVRQKLSPMSSEFERLAARVVSGGFQSIPITSIDGELAQMRQSLATLEAGLPELLQATERLSALQNRYNEVVATAQEIEINEGQTIYFNPTNHDPEIAMLTLQVEAIRNSGYLEQARALIAKAERIADRRRARARQAAALRQEIETIAQQLPAPDETLWRERTATFRARADGLFAAAASAEGADDTAAFTALQRDLAAFFQEQSAVCGDLLEPPAKVATNCSRFAEVYDEFNRQQLWRELGPDFWQSMDQLVWPKVRGRVTVTKEALTLADDVAKWLATGTDRAARAQRFAELRAQLDPKQPAQDVASQLERLNRLDVTLRAWPAKLVENERRVWHDARIALVRGGQLEAWLRNQPRPYVCFAVLDEKDAEQGFYWPEKAERGSPRTERGMPVCVTLKNVADDTNFVLQESRDGGKRWSNVLYSGRRWRSFLMWQSGEHRFRALLPDGSETIDLPAFPHYLPPLS